MHHRVEAEENRCQNEDSESCAPQQDIQDRHVLAPGAGTVGLQFNMFIGARMIARVMVVMRGSFGTATLRPTTSSSVMASHFRGRLWRKRKNSAHGSSESR